MLNVRIYDYHSYIDNGFILFDKEIIKVGKMADYVSEGYEEIEGHRALVLPNFVCCHTHIYSAFARGLSLPFDPKNFQDILDQLWWKIDKKLDFQAVNYSAMAIGREFLKNGVTTIIDHHASGKDIIGSLTAVRDGLEIAGLRSILCFETSDRFNINECIEENSYFISQQSSSNMCKGIFGLHASMSLSTETLLKVKDALGENPIHIHVAESKLDVEDSYRKYEVGIIQRLDDLKLLKTNSLIVHGVHLTEDELALLGKKKVYLVVNTLSNMNNAVGFPNVKKMMNYNIPVLAGNDGLFSSMAAEYINIYYASKFINGSPTGFSLDDIKKIINNSYEYVNKLFDVKLGRIKEGYEADFLTVPYVPFTEIDKNNAFAHIFNGLFPSFVPRDVYMGGQCLVKGGRVLNSRLDRAMIKAQEISSKLWQELKEE